MSETGAQLRLQNLTAEKFVGVFNENPVILLPLGSHEDHGPQQPMGDFALADLLAGRIAARAVALGQPCFVAPCLPFGVADHFGASPGGLALSPASFRAVLTDLLDGLLRHGLTRLLLLNAHGGNVPVIHEVTLSLRRRQGVVVPSFYLWKIARQLMERHTGPGGGRFGHGAEPLLSLNLALRPAAVDLTPHPAPPAQSLLGLKVADFGTLDFEGLAIEAPVEFDAVPRPAIAPALAAASAGLGEAVAAELVEVAARFVLHLGRQG